MTIQRTDLPARGIISLAASDATRRVLSRIASPKLAAFLLLLFFWAISLHHLTIVPRGSWDEPWIASTGWKLAAQGVFGSDLFAGLNGMDQRYYDFLPLFPLLLAGTFRVAGVGLFQDRFVVVALGLLTLALTYRLAQRLFRDPRIAFLAVLLLATVGITAQSTYQVSGIFFLDVTRFARYDPLAAMLGLGSLHAYLSGQATRKARWYLAAGILAGLTGLAHFYGLFWVPVFVVLTLWDHGLRRPRQSVMRVALIGVGVGIALLPYVLYVLGDVSSWRAQTAVYYRTRIGGVDLHWYLENLLREPERYAPGFELDASLLLRIGFWSTLLGLPLSLAALAWRAWRRADHSSRVLFVAAVTIPVLFALLVQLKRPNYALTLYPLGAIVAAWGALTFWQWLGRTHRRRWGRVVLAALLIAVLAEGATRIGALELAARTTTPYYQFVAQLRRSLPNRARILAWHNFWFGLEDFDYRSFWVPFAWLESNNQPRPLRLDEGLDRIAPDVVLVDDAMRRYLVVNASPANPNPRLFYDWMKRHDAHLIGRIEDRTYGLVEVYRVTRTNEPRATKQP